MGRLFRNISPSFSLSLFFFLILTLPFSSLKNLKGKRLKVEQATPTTKVFFQDHRNGFEIGIISTTLVLSET